MKTIRCHCCLTKFNRAKTSLWRCAVWSVSALVIGAIAPACLWADDTRDKLLAAEPLAECQVQPLPGKEEPQSMPSNPLLLLGQPEEEDPLNYYQRTQDGEWAIAHQPDRDDPWIRLLVFSPASPLLVDIAVKIDAQPFRAAREQWID
ncbi:MAG: hypothetical protein MI725_12105, partial [Pirellulales bacterium]|nr:hypothetical protein [Pirellulales bacterium]